MKKSNRNLLTAILITLAIAIILTLLSKGTLVVDSLLKFWGMLLIGLGALNTFGQMRMPSSQVVSNQEPQNKQSSYKIAIPVMILGIIVYFLPTLLNRP